MCSKKIGLWWAQNIYTIIRSTISLKGGRVHVTTMWPFNVHKKLHYDNEEDNHTTSKNNEKIGYIKYLKLAIISHQLHVSQPMRGGYIAKNGHLRPAYLSHPLTQVNTLHYSRELAVFTPPWCSSSHISLWLLWSQINFISLVFEGSNNNNNIDVLLVASAFWLLWSQINFISLVFHKGDLQHSLLVQFPLVCGEKRKNSLQKEGTMSKWECS